MIIGLLVAKQFQAPLLPALSAAGLLALLCLTISQRERLRRLWLPSFMLASSLAFWAYGELRLPGSPSHDTLALPAREAPLEFEVLRVIQPRSPFDNASGIGRIIDAPILSRLRSEDKIYFRVKLAPEFTEQITRGHKIKASGILRPMPQTENSDSFESYLKAQGAHYQFTRTTPATISGEPSPFQQFCQRMHHRFLDTLHLGAPENNPVVNIYPAMLLGHKAELNSDQSERFRTTGTMHFFAISGLHIGVIATVIAQALLLFRVPRRLGPWIGLPLLYLYVEITGAAPSAVRAFLMAAFFWASYALIRQRSPLGALAASAVGVLLVAPQQLWSVGFQLSYTVVLSILLFGLPLHEALQQRLRPYQWLPTDSWTPRHHATAWASEKVLLLFAISLSAWLASTPLSAGLFGIITPSAVVLNMLLVYFATLVICGGVISISLGLIGLPFLSGFLNHAAWLNLSIMDTLVTWSTKLPGGILRSDNFPTAFTHLSLIGYFTLLTWLHRDRTRLDSYALLLPPAWILTLVTLGYIWGLIAK